MGLVIVMLLSEMTYSQVSFDIYGNLPSFGESKFRLNSLEGNPLNFNLTKDWEFSLSLSTFFSTPATSNLHMVSIAKRFNGHYLYARYTPGILRKFEFTKAESKVDDSLQVFKTNLVYQERFGFGYSYNLTKELSAGFSFRYFQQDFSEQFPEFIADTTKQVIITQTEEINKNFWRGDIGIEYIPFDNLRLSLYSHNFFILGENFKNDTNSDFEIKTNHFDIKTNKSAIFNISYLPWKFFNLNMTYETSNSFIIGANTGFKLFGENLAFGISVLHDRFQEPTIAGINPKLSYSNELLSITFSGIHYFGSRNKTRSLNEFRIFGIHSLTNNYFSNDMAFLNFNLALSFRPEKSVKILDVKILKEIYPTLADVYLNQPFAVAKVVNLTNKKVTVKPSSYISEINKESVQSPQVTILPKDTLKIPFYTIVKENLNIQKRKIEQVAFILKTTNSTPDDEIQKPILVNDVHSWDGNVRNLKYFVEHDYDFSTKYAKKILSAYKDSLEQTNISVRNFLRVKILFNEFAKKMSYVADRRASFDNVQFPSETIELKGGDCDDLSVFFASLLEGIGIQTAFVDYKPIDNIGHVNLMINTNLTPQQASLITSNDKKFIIRKNTDGKDEVWIPLEVTDLTNFESAWDTGAKKFYEDAINKLGLAKGNVEIIDNY